MLALALAWTAALAAPQDPGDASWPAERARRARWWSWQPVVRYEPSELPRDSGWDDWRDQPVDRFVGARLAAAGLGPTPPADRATLLRRAQLVLTGLPPTRAEVAAFVADERPEAYVERVDALLESRAYAERFARHWMDWLRYAETHGSEGDPAVPHAWRYRDYLIRALERDVPYDQLVREHLAGDLLDAPRVDAARGVIESRLGTAQLRFVQHGYSPTDALEEKVRFVDDQIDALSKAFLGLTVSCARCHDHKFDAISQADWQAFYGILGSTRPALRAIDRPADLRAVDAGLDAMRGEIRDGLAAAWRRAVDGLGIRLAGVAAGELEQARGDATHPLHVLARARVEPGRVADVFVAARRDFVESRDRIKSRPPRIPLAGWHLGGAALTTADGRPRRDAVAPPGAFQVLPHGDRILDAILPSGIWSHLRSSRHAAVAATATFDFDMQRLAVRIAGDGGARARYVVEGYPRGGTVYPIHRARGGGRPRMVSWDVGYWRGERGWIEVSTAADQPVDVDVGAERSWFGVTDAFVLGPGDQVPQDEIAEFVAPLFAAERAPTTLAELEARYVDAIRAAVDAWATATIDDVGARFLGGLLRAGVLPSTLAEVPQVTAAVARYRALERRAPLARRAPGVRDAEPVAERLMVRGDHHQRAEPVPHRFLESIEPTPYPAGRPSRLQLADDFVAADNPFTARVAVNRIWHHVFGRGIVATPDNFGRLGEAPSHPELLDTLAADFVASGWSIRTLVRRLVLSQAFRQSAVASPQALRVDPDNRLFSRHRFRRLEAEVIRDAMLAVSGRLDPTPFGPSVGGDVPRRSVYVSVRRNDLDPFLQVFDFPTPHAARGRRDVTSVPAQALTMANDPFVLANARAFAEAVRGEGDTADDATTARLLLERAYARPAASDEVALVVDSARALREDAVRLAAEARRLEAEIVAARDEIDAIRAPVRALLLRQRGSERAVLPPGPAPLARWNFDRDAADDVGALHGTLRGSARIEDGALVLDGEGWVETGPLVTGLAARTLSAFVILDGLEQRGGGVVAVETPDGARFDAVVFGEKDPGQWLAGSDHFHRTRSFDGPRERDADGRAVHVVIAWAADGTIRAWRDGEPYGRAYRADGTFRPAAGAARLLFGLRHSPSAGGKRLRGRILHAELHDRALTDDEVRRAVAAGPLLVSEADVDAALAPDARRSVVGARSRIRAFRAARSALGVPEGYRDDAADVWRSIAQSLFASKEFVFLR